MQTWAKRGLQTALVTGGLLMLGTGIASAQEDVNPDKPANPLDGSLSIPLQIKDNAVGTPLGQMNLPNVDQTVSSDAVTSKLPQPLSGTTEKLTGELGKAAAPATGTISGVTSQTAKTQTQAAPSLSDPSLGNRVHNHAAVPIQIAGNALALGGPAKVHTDASQNFSRPAPASTGANGAPLGGNVLGLDGAVPVQLANNAVGIGSKAESKGMAKQHVDVGGPVNTDGSATALAGNVLKGHLATPLQVTGNAVAGGGGAKSDSKAQTGANAGGAIKTTGKNGQLSGNIGAVPAALPIELNGNALSGIGKAQAASQNKAHAQAGATNADSLGNPFYTLTNGDPAALAGNIVQPELAGPAMLNGLAGSLAGNSAAVGQTDNHVVSGGGAGTSGKGSAISGNIVNAPAAYPLQAFGDAAAVGGGAVSGHKNKVDSKAGGSNMAYGDGSTLSANDVVPTLAGSGDIFGSGLSALGKADGVGKNKTKSHAGGYVGTTGNNSQGSGNIVHPPLALPVQAFGLGGSAIGQATGTATNKKDIGSGGPPNSNDDNGVVSSNVAHTPGSLPVELFGDSVPVLANAKGVANSELKSRAGGNATGTGKKGTIAGNVVQGALSAPLQGFGDSVGLAGIGNAVGKGVTASKAGGDSTSTGEGGSLAGNAVNVPAGGAGQLFGNTVGVIGNYTGIADNDATSNAGGNTNTSGAKGAISGNAIAGQLMPILQGFGNGIAAGANGKAAASNNTAVGSGGDINTSGKGGALSGNILDVPAAVVGQAFGNALAVAGNQQASAENNLVGAVGGKDSSSGELGSGSGFVGQYPIGIVGQLYNVPGEILGNAMTSAKNATSVTVADKPAEFNFPVDGAQLPINQLPQLPSVPGLPGLPGLSSLPALPGGGALPTQSGGPVATQSAAAKPKPISAPANPISGLTGELPAVPGLAGGLPKLPALPKLPGVGELPVQDLPQLPQLPGLGGALPQLPALPGLPTQNGGNPISGLTGELPAVPGLAGGLPKLPALPKLPGVGELPVQSLPQLPGLPGAGGGGVLPDLPGDLDGALGGGALPQLPDFPGAAASALPAVAGGLLQSLPAVGGSALPKLPGVGGSALPKLPGVGGALPVQELPALGGDLPALPGVGGALPGVSGVSSALSGLSSLQGVADGGVPALSGIDSGNITGSLGNLPLNS